MLKKYYLEVLIVVCVILITVKLFFIDYFVVSSRSMENTLKINDIVFINKIAASYTYNDIVVFKMSNHTNKLIKRVIAMPNDSIEIENTQILINNKLVKENENIVHQYQYFDSQVNNYSLKSISNSENSNKKDKIKYKKYIVNDTIKFYGLDWTLDNLGPLWIPKKGSKIIITNKNFSVYQHILKKETNLDYFDLINKSYEFKNDYYFLMGDNRHNSRDSRYYGLISKLDIIGKLIY